MNQDLLKLSAACLTVADEIERGKLRMKDLRRSRVFFDNGGCGCAFGHVLIRAGMKGRMAPFHIKGPNGGRSARWLNNADAFTGATGVLVSGEGRLFAGLEDLELANDVPSGNERRTKVLVALRDLSSFLHWAAKLSK